MCGFCELKRNEKTGDYWWGKTGERVDGFYIDQRIKITEDGREYDVKDIALEYISDEYEQSLAINYCPMCGRKFGEL